MAAINTLCSVTEKSTSTVFKLGAKNIITFYLDPVTPGTGTVIVYDNLETVKNITVTNTPAAVNALTLLSIAVTPATGVTQYVNAEKIILVETSGTGAKITYGTGRGTANQITVAETAAAITTAVNALVPVAP